MICYINRTTVDYDIRLRKYVTACLETQTSYCVISWDRMHNCEKLYPNETQYHRIAPYGAKLKNFTALVGWVFFVWKQLIKKRKEYKVIHACNLENAVIAYPARLLGKKLVLDVYDSLNTSMEAKMAKKIEGLILPNDHRLNQIGIKKEDAQNYLEVENVPAFQTTVRFEHEPDFKKKIRLSYVGVMQREIRGIENLLQLVKDDDRFELDIAGVGDGMEKDIEEAEAICSRIHYHHKVAYEKALQLMADADFIIAMYYMKAKVHEYASPNKYYESLYLGKPIVTTKGTLVGSNVEANNTGYAIGECLENLKELFSKADSNKFLSSYKDKSQNCIKLWNEKYKDYSDNITVGKYIHMMERIADK